MRDDGNVTELPEMSVEAECRLDCEPLHDDSTCAVGETPTLVAKCREDVPGRSEIGWRDPLDLTYRPIAKLIAQPQRSGEFAANLEQCQQFVENIVGCHKILPVCLDPFVRSRMIGIAWDDRGKPGPCVNENHFSAP